MKRRFATSQLDPYWQQSNGVSGGMYPTEVQQSFPSHSFLGEARGLRGILRILSMRGVSSCTLKLWRVTTAVFSLRSPCLKETAEKGAIEGLDNREGAMAVPLTGNQRLGFSQDDQVVPKQNCRTHTPQRWQNGPLSNRPMVNHIGFQHVSTGCLRLITSLRLTYLTTRNMPKWPKSLKAFWNRLPNEVVGSLSSHPKECQRVWLQVPHL